MSASPARNVALTDVRARATGEVTEIPPEGSLAPDTYGAQRGDDRNALIARMTAAQEARLAADEITATNEADGVAIVLERLLGERP